MASTLYIIPYSQPVRATLMAISALNLDVKLKEVNLIEKQQLSNTFKKINPQHTVPTLVEEDGFVLWDSHAIMAYLVDRYGKSDFLYPRDLRKRAIVNQRLHFDNEVLFNLNILGPIIYEGFTSVPQKKKENLEKAYNILEIYLQNDFVAGDSLTIADFSIMASISTLDLVVPIDETRFPKTVYWMKKMKQLSCYQANKDGLQQIKEIIHERLCKV